MEASSSEIHGGFSWQTGPACFQDPSKRILDLWKRKLQFLCRSKKNFLVTLWPGVDRLRPPALSVFRCQWRQISFLWLVIALPRESHSWEIRSKNKSVYENAVTGMWSSCTFQVMGSWWNLRDLGSEAQSLTWSSQLWALFKWERSEDLNGIWTLTSAIPMRYSSGPGSWKDD